MSQAQPVDGRYVRRFFAYALDYRWLLAAAIFSGLSKFGLNYTFPWLIGTATDTVIRPVGDAAAWTDSQRVGHLEWLLLLGVVLSLAHGTSTYFRGFLSAKLGSRIIRDLRQDLFDHLHRLSLHFYAKERTGSIVSRLITDIQTASQIVNGGLISLVMDIFSLVVGVVLLVSIDWRIAVAALAVMPLYAVTFKLLNPRVKKASAAVQSQISKISGTAQEKLAGIALVKTYAAERRESDRFKEDTEEHYDRVIQQSTLAQSVSSISETLVHLGQTIVIGLGGWLAIRGDMTAGDVIKSIGYLAVMYLPVRRFAEINVVYATSLAAIERVFQVFDITPKMFEKPDAVRQKPTGGRVAFEGVCFDYTDDSDETRIRLEDHDGPAASKQNGARRDPGSLTPAAHNSAKHSGATHSSPTHSGPTHRGPTNIGPHHPGDDTPSPDRAAPTGEGDLRPRKWVLDDLSFTVEPGEKIALVGPSGSGKTTLVSLLPRLYDPNRGRIAVDGVDLRDYSLRHLRKAIGIVQQDSLLFSGTIRENLCYGRPKATQAQIEEAARAANAHDFILDLEGGYDARIGERGVTLSGGQRQRISIARALLKDPRILILDEATSALDSESEFLVQQALARLMVGRTCFIIAHRLSTVRDADRILVLQAGRIVETGTHTQLLEGQGLYSRLCRQQFGLETPAPAPLATAS